MSIKKSKSNLLVTGRDKVIELENSLINMADEKNIVTTQDTELFPLKHTFADGIYVRQMGMDKGSSVIGAIHNHEHVWFLLKIISLHVMLYQRLEQRELYMLMKIVFSLTYIKILPILAI